MKRYNWKQQNKLAIQKQLLLMHYVIMFRLLNLNVRLFRYKISTALHNLSSILHY